jgi:peptidoglycan hydrolase FlgJ
MDIAGIQSRVKASELPLEQLAANRNLSEQDKIGELSRQFEAVLLRQILGEAQRTVIKSKYSGESLASGIYQDMTTNQLADSISKSGSFGLARSLNQQLDRQLKKP